MVPSNARIRRVAMEERIEKLSKYVEDFPMNELIMGDTKLGIISSGIGYQYAREVFKDASFLKLVTTYPVPEELIRKFASQVEKVIVIEELDPHLEEATRLLGIPVEGKSIVFYTPNNVLKYKEVIEKDGKRYVVDERKVLKGYKKVVVKEEIEIIHPDELDIDWKKYKTRLNTRIGNILNVINMYQKKAFEVISKSQIARINRWCNTKLYMPEQQKLFK